MTAAMTAAMTAPASAETRLQKLSGFLYGFAAAMFVVIPLELLASKHWKDPIQFVPFALCLLGLIATMLAWKRPGRSTVLALRVVAAVNAIGAMVGVFEHLDGNLGFVTEMHPDAAGWTLVKGVLTGRAPALASGALVIAAVVALAASWAAAPVPVPAQAQAPDPAEATQTGRRPVAA